MSKELNIGKLALAVEKSPLSKVDLAKKCGISRVTLDSVIKGKEIGLFKFLKLIDALDSKVGYFFDEEDIQIREAGRDYVEKGKIEHHGIEYSGNTSEADLREMIAQLKSQLADKERIIKMMESNK